MTLPVPNLDDRKFQELVDEAKRRIPRHLPEWTNHNVADPGVALIELFAWMTEVALFRLNQVPDAFYTHMLNLIGFRRFPSTAARAGVTFWLVDVVDAPVVVPKGTEVSTSVELGTAAVFNTLEDLVISQPELMASLTSTGDENDVGGPTYTDVWDELRVRARHRDVLPERADDAGRLLLPGLRVVAGRLRHPARHRGRPRRHRRPARRAATAVGGVARRRTGCPSTCGWTRPVGSTATAGSCSSFRGPTSRRRWPVSGPTGCGPGSWREHRQADVPRLAPLAHGHRRRPRRHGRGRAQRAGAARGGRPQQRPARSAVRGEPPARARPRATASRSRSSPRTARTTTWAEVDDFIDTDADDRHFTWELDVG